MKKKRVSSEDVARHAGVSRTTVSFVLNNTPGKNISEETRQKVLEAAAELEYTPNENARRLAMTRHTAVGLFVCHSKSAYSDVFVVRLVEGMTQVLNRHRLQLLIQPVDPEREDYLSLARTDSADGIVLLNTHENDPALDEVIEADFPLVVIGSAGREDVYQVNIDNRAAAAEVIRYLAELGHSEIGMITQAPPVFSSTRERISGYRDALIETGLSPRDEWLQNGDFTEQSGFECDEQTARTS